MPEKTYTLEELKTYAFFACQYCAKINHVFPGKLINKYHVDEFIEVEVGLKTVETITLNPYTNVDNSKSSRGLNQPVE